MIARRLLVAGALVLAAGCQSDLDAKRSFPKLDEPYFRCHVEPELVKSCGTLGCHGTSERYFRIFGRNRFRALLGADEDRQRNTPLSEKEQTFNFESALGFVDPAHLDESYLLQKPLDQKAGGFYHGGATKFGQGDVYTSRDDAGFKILHDWIHGAKEDDPKCVKPSG